MTSLESKVGRKLDLHRPYYFWDTAQPTSVVKWDLEQGRTPIISIEARKNNNTRIRWASIASGAEDATLRAHARGLKSLGAPVWLIFHHEPEDDIDTTAGMKNGTPAEFAAAYRHLVEVFRDEGVTNVSFAWNMMAWSFKIGRADAYYPGDDVIDWAAADGYNWYGCDNTSVGRWLSFTEIFDSFRNWGIAHNKPLMLAEWGSLEDPASPGRKAAWIKSSTETIKQWPEIKALTYYHSKPAGSTCDWWVDTSASSLDAFSAMAADPYFNPAAAPTTTTTVAPTTTTTVAPTTTTTVAPSPPVLSAVGSSVVEGNGSATVAFTVSLAPASSQDVTVSYATNNGKATAGADYRASSGALTFAPGETSKVISVPVHHDTLDETWEGFRLDVTNPTLGVVEAWGGITDDDPTPSLSIRDARIQEGHSGTRSVSLDVVLPVASGQSVSVYVTTANGSAVAPGDYQSMSTRVTFAPGETRKSVSVSIVGDKRREKDETFSVTLSNPANASIADGSGMVTIVNDD